MDILEKRLQGNGLGWQLNRVEVSPGRFAALVVSKTITELPAICHARAAAEGLSITLGTALKAERPALPNGQRPSCSVDVLSRRRRQVWRIGDCQSGS